MVPHRHAIELAALALLAWTAAGCALHDDVSEPPDGDNASLKPQDPTIGLEKTVQLEVVTGDGDTVPATSVSWTSRNKSVATVDKNGVVTGNAAGSAVVNAKWLNADLTSVVTVEERIEAVELKPSSPAPPVGGAVCMEARPLNARDKLMENVSVSWSSKDTKVASVQKKGSRRAVVTGKSGGTTTITAEATRSMSSKTVSSSVDATSTPWVTVAAGPHLSCGLTDDGKAYCWGSDREGALGNGSESGNKPNPTPVATDHLTGSNGGSPPKFVEIAVGTFRVCARSASKNIYCWGASGFGSAIEKPQKVKFQAKAVDIAVGGFHMCGVSESGTVKCWGASGCGQVSSVPPMNCENPDKQRRGTPDPRAIKSPQDGDPSFESVVAGKRHTCALSESGDVYCWGWASHGQLGNGHLNGVADDPDGTSEVAFTTPQRVDPSTTTSGSTETPTTPFTALTAGQRHTCALDDDGDIFCWGENTRKQTGPHCSYSSANSTADKCARPSHVPFSKTAAAIFPADHHTCIVDSDDKGYCWGWSGDGQLGNGSQNSSAKPVAISGSQTFTSLAGGGFFNYDDGGGDGHTCGTTGAGRVKCWGINGDGALGNGQTSGGETTPVDVAFTDPCDG